MTKQKILFLFLAFAAYSSAGFGQGELPSIKPTQEKLKAGWVSSLAGGYIAEVPIDVDSADHRPTPEDAKSVFSDGWKDRWQTKDISFSLARQKFKVPPANARAARDHLNEKMGLIALEGGFLPSYIPGPPYGSDIPRDVVWEALSFTNGTSTIYIRLFIRGDSIYSVYAVFTGSDPARRETALRFMNSFRFVEASKIREMRIAAATPAPLPQAGAEKRKGSDALDRRIKGAVKTVTERTVYHDPAPKALPPPGTDLYYDEAGNLTRMTIYNGGEPVSVRSYGYIDGKRAYLSVAVAQDQNGLLPLPAARTVPKPDTRFTQRFEYTYDESGHMVTEKCFNNIGQRVCRREFVYSRGRVEIRSFNEREQLTQMRVEKLDGRGNVSEYTAQADGRTTRFVYTYEGFDGQGNWTRRKLFEEVAASGKPKLVLLDTTERTISYY